MVTLAQAKLNVASATRVVSRELGYLTAAGDVRLRNQLTATEQIELTNSVAAFIRSRPDLFDTGERDLTNPYNSAALASNAAIESTEFSLAQFVDAAAENARAINPLDPQNIGTVGKYLLGAVVIVAVVYVGVRFLPAALAKAKA